jgi:hypothetical protein
MDVVIGLGIGEVLVVVRLLDWFQQGRMPQIMLDNLASRWGAPANGYLIGGRPLLFSDAAWTLFNLVALGAAVVVIGVGVGILGAHIRRLNRSIPNLLHAVGSQVGIVVLFCLAVAGGLVLFGSSRPLFDRYFWPLVVPLAILFLYLPSDLSRERGSGSPLTTMLGVTAVAVGALLSVASLFYMLNSVAFDSARWRAGEWLVRAGLRPDQVDAGYEWVGYHATSQGDPIRRTSTETFYRSWWPSLKQCGLVTSEGPSPENAELLQTITYELKLVVGPTEILYLYRSRSSDCSLD